MGVKKAYMNNADVIAKSESGNVRVKVREEVRPILGGIEVAFSKNVCD